MERAEAEALRVRLESIVRQEWQERDPAALVTGHLRADNRIDLTVISQQFAGMGSEQREADFWPVFDTVPKSDLLHMTYCLLLTPEEAARHFTAAEAPPPADNTDEWG